MVLVIGFVTDVHRLDHFSGEHCLCTNITRSNYLERGTRLPGLAWSGGAVAEPVDIIGRIIPYPRGLAWGQLLVTNYNPRIDYQHGWFIPCHTH